MYEQVFKNIDDTLRQDAGSSSELDYIEQTSWILFLKYLHDYEDDKETAALLNGDSYKRIIDGKSKCMVCRCLTVWLTYLLTGIVRRCTNTFFTIQRFPASVGKRALHPLNQSQIYN